MRRLYAVAAAIVLALTLVPVAAASPRSDPTDLPQMAGAENGAPSACARGVLPTLETDLTGKLADVAEQLQAKYENEPGFLSVVFGGGTFWIVVDGVSSGEWTKPIPTDVAKVVTSCIESGLIDSAKSVVAEAKYSEGEYSSVLYDVFTDSVRVTSTQDSEFLADAIGNRVASTAGVSKDYSADDLRIVSGEVGSGSRLSRGSDSPSFWGGARINTPDGSCTTGFYINSVTNGTVMVTAGHCGLNGDTVFNGNNSQVVGTMEGRVFPNPDLAVIDGQAYAARSYSANDQTSSKPIVNAASPSTAITYCQMGFVSLRICSSYSSLNAQFCDELGCTNSLAFTSRACTSPLGQPGDSGGGVFKELAGSQLGARGIVIAGAELGPGGQCGRYDHRWATIQARYNATIETP